MVPMPASSKSGYVIDNKTILSCLDQALQRGAWDELRTFVVADKFTGLRINIEPETIVDWEDETNPVDIDHQVKRLAALSDKGRLTAKTTALVRQAIEHYRAKAAQSSHISVAVACQMARYRLSMQRLQGSS